MQTDPSPPHGVTTIGNQEGIDTSSLERLRRDDLGHYRLVEYAEVKGVIVPVCERALVLVIRTITAEITTRGRAASAAVPIKGR